MKAGILGIGFFFFLFTASAWNDTGHMVVSELAWRGMSKSERIKASNLLKQHPHYALLLNKDIPSNVDADEWVFLKASTWPDMVRPAQGKPVSISKYHRDVWHYINLPFVKSSDAGNVTAQPPKLTNAVERLAWLETQMKSSDVPAEDRAVALCWYLHLMGDLHQPLHAVAWFSPEFTGGDKGGNDVAVQPKTSPKKLHSLWDGLLGSGESFTFIDQVADDIKETWPSSRLRKESKNKTYLSWAEESRDAAIAFAYLDGNVPHAKWKQGIKAADVPELDTGYEGNAQMIAKRRAAIAGSRLKTKLKGIF